MEQHSKSRIINIEIYTDGSLKKVGQNKLYPVNRTVGVLKNPTDRQAITLKFGQRIQAGIH